MKRHPIARPAPSQVTLDPAVLKHLTPEERAELAQMLGLAPQGKRAAFTLGELRAALLVAADLLDPPGKQRRARQQAGKNARPEAGR
jgi:hypothetical protein